MKKRFFDLISKFFTVGDDVIINNNGWDDLKGDPNWKDYSKELPEDGQKILMCYLEKIDDNNFKRNYEQVIYCREVDENYLILNWKNVD